jgi:uncharacterized protein YkwD
MSTPRSPEPATTTPALTRSCLLGALLLASFTTACGGNGTVTDSGNPGPATACNIPDLQSQLLLRINQLRAQSRRCGAEGNFAATTPVTWNNKLFNAAVAHNTDMATRGYFDHNSPEGVSMAQRVTTAGYDWSAVAENIGFGQADVAAILATWIASDGHCANIMNSAYREVGLSCMRSGSGTNYWTMNLASP